MKATIRIGIRSVTPAILAAAPIGLSALERPAADIAGGFFLYEIGTPDVGLASAGYASRSHDAPMVFSNPAEMTWLDHSELLIVVQQYYGYQVFSTNHRTTRTRSNGGNALVPLPNEGFFCVYSLRPNLKLGIGDTTYSVAQSSTTSTGSAGITSRGRQLPATAFWRRLPTALTNGY